MKTELFYRSTKFFIDYYVFWENIVSLCDNKTCYLSFGSFIKTEFVLKRFKFCKTRVSL